MACSMESMRKCAAPIWRASSRAIIVLPTPGSPLKMTSIFRLWSFGCLAGKCVELAVLKSATLLLKERSHAGRFRRGSPGWLNDD